MLDNVDHIHDFVNSTWRRCSLLGSWFSGLISKPYRKLVSEDIFFWRSFIFCGHVQWYVDYVHDAFRRQVGSAFNACLSRLAEERENCYLEFMEKDFICISSDDDIEEIEDPKRTLPQWATTERNSGW